VHPPTYGARLLLVRASLFSRACGTWYIASSSEIPQNAANRKYARHKSLRSRGTDKVLSYWCKQIKTGFVLPERQHICRQLVRRQTLKFREVLIKLLVHS